MFSRTIGFVLLGFLLISNPAYSEERLQKEPSPGEKFQEATNLSWSRSITEAFTYKVKQPPMHKSYPDAQVFPLPEPSYDEGLRVEDAIRKRRSVRNYANKPLELNHLSQLLFAAQGETYRAGPYRLRATPSAGALYPIEIYVIVNNVKELQKGVYHYNVRAHALELIKMGDFRKPITQSGLDQDMLGQANVVFALTAIFDRVRFKYGERGYRYAYMEAGHISQNIYLQSVSLGLGSVSVGAFLDDKVNELLEVDGREETTLYLHPAGSL